MSRRDSWIALLGLAACDPIDFHDGSGDTGSDSDPTRDTGPPPDTFGGATQVGSEGLWGCPVVGMTPIDGGLDIPGVGTPEALADTVTGTWVVDFADGAGARTQGGFYWRTTDLVALAKAGGACDDFVVVGITGTTIREGQTLPVDGRLGFDGSRIAALVWPVASVATVESSWGVTAPEGAEGLRMRLEVDPLGALSGAASFSPCREPGWSCAGDEVALTLSAVRP